VRRSVPDVSQVGPEPASVAGLVTSTGVVTRAIDGVLTLSSAVDPAKIITNTFCGTEQYMAPEVLLQRGHSGTRSALTFRSFCVSRPLVSVSILIYFQ
jgi:hypothetical protein